jgi:hypothetical protein
MESLGINSNVHTGMQCTRIQLPARCSYKPTVCVSVLCSRLKRSCRRLTSSLGHLQFQSMPLRISGELDTAWRESQMIDRRRQLSMQQARTRSIVCSARCRLVSGCRGRSSTLARRVDTLPASLQVLRVCFVAPQHLLQSSIRESVGYVIPFRQGSRSTVCRVGSSSFHPRRHSVNGEGAFES